MGVCVPGEDAELQWQGAPFVPTIAGGHFRLLIILSFHFLFVFLPIRKTPVFLCSALLLALNLGRRTLSVFGTFCVHTAQGFATLPSREISQLSEAVLLL